MEQSFHLLILLDWEGSSMGWRQCAGQKAESEQRTALSQTESKFSVESLGESVASESRGLRETSKRVV